MNRIEIIIYYPRYLDDKYEIVDSETGRILDSGSAIDIFESLQNNDYKVSGVVEN